MDFSEFIHRTEPVPAPAPEAAPEPAPAAAAQSFAKGDLVVHVVEGPERKIVQTGMVLEALEGDRVIVGWFAGFSGPCAVAELTAL